MKPLQAYLTEIGARVEERLNDLVPLANLPYSPLFESARTSLLAPARRLHPIFAVATAEMLGCDSETALIPACALEMVHTYSLIDHTDRQTLLAGNYLLTRAFEVSVTAPNLSPHQKLTLTQILSSRAGAHGLIGGQTLEHHNAGHQIELDTLQTVHALKTAALITASFEFGGVLGNADDETMMILQTTGEALGLAYQITEDILANDPDQTTYPTLLGPTQAQQTAEYLADCAFDAIEALPGDPTLLLQLAELITESTT